MLIVGGLVVGAVMAASAFALAMLSTAPGHNYVRQRAIRLLEQQIDGTVRVGSLTGSLWHAADLRDVELATLDGKSAIRVARVRVRFALADLFGGRIRLMDVTIDRPHVVLERHSTGRWNIERLFRLGGTDSGPPARRPLVEFRRLRIVDGTVVMRERPERGSGRIVERTATGVDLAFERLRASHPDSAGMSAQISSIGALVRNPDLDLRGARGSILLNGDSLSVALDRVRLPDTEAQINATVVFGAPRTTYAATLIAERVTFADLHGVLPRLPAEGGGSISAMLRRAPSGATEIELAGAELRSGRSRVTGKAHAVISPAGALSIRAMDIGLQPLDLVQLEPFVDSLPVSGLVEGRLAGNGTLGDLAVTTDLRWTDERLAPAPTNTVRGRGVLLFGGRDQLVFRAFRVTPAEIDARTLAAFAPSVVLTGRLNLTGELNGAWRQARFSGELVHAGSAEATTVRGDIAIGLGPDTVTLDVDVVAESLSLDLLRRSYPGIPVGGNLAGRLRLNGPIDAFNVSASLGGPAGGFSAIGRVGVSDRATLVELDGTFDSLDLSGFRPSAPPTSLSGGWSVALSVPRDTARVTTGTIRLSLQPGFVAGVPIRSGGLLARLEQGLFAADSMRLESPGGVITATGSFGRGAGARGQIALALVSDTLAYLEPLVRWSRARSGDTSEVRLDGSGEIRGRVTGSMSAWVAQGNASFGSINAAGAQVRRGRADGTINGGDAGLSMTITASADSAAIGALAYAPVGLALSGSPDSLGIAVSAGFARTSSVNAKVSVWGDSVMRVVTLDSVRLDLPVRTWHLARPAGFAMTEGVMVFDTVEFLPVSGSGRILADGLLPLGGVGDFRVSVESLSVVDLSSVLSRDTSGIGGAIDLTLHIAGPSLTPTIEMALVLQDGRYGDYRAPMVQTLARYNDRLLTLKGGLWRDTLRVVALNGALPVDLALEGVERRRLPGPVSIVARSDSADLEVFSPFTTVVRDLAGRVSLDVSVGGTWEALEYTGFVDIADGSMTVPSLGARYTGMDVRLDLQRHVIVVTRGHIGGGPGVLDVSGEVRLAGAGTAGDEGTTIGRPRMDLALRARRFKAFDLREFGGVTATGDMVLRGPVLGGTLTGQVRVDEGYLRFADLVQKRIVSLDDPEFRAIVDSSLAIASDLGPEFHQVFMDSLRIDSLGVSMGPDVWLRSTEANIQLSGDFAVHKAVQGGQVRYRMEGTLQAVRGNYRLAFAGIAKDFRVTRGNVRFYGTPDFNPDLEISAEHTLRTYQNQPLTVRAQITGTLLYPRLRLESDQRAAMSETEIVSYLVTGAPVGAGSGLSSAFAQSLVLGMAGQVGQSIVTELGLPLDYLTISPGAPTSGSLVGSTGQTLRNARIGAGAQLGRRTFLQLTAGLCEVIEAQRLGASIEYRLRSSLSLNAAFEPIVQDCGVSSSLSGFTATYQLSFDLFWQRGLR